MYQTGKTEVSLMNNNPDTYGSSPYGQPVQNNQYYQNIYNMFGGYNPIVDKEASGLRRYGMLAGGAILATCVLQNIGILFLRIFGIANLFSSNADYMNGISIFFQIFYLFIPFAALLLLSSKQDRSRIMVFGKPKSPELYVFAVFAGLMVCTVANYADTLLLSGFSAAGVDFISGTEDNPVPQDIPGYILMILNIAVVPALIEEFAFRGVLLQPLRKYGDGFAVAVTSIVFALLHGNMTQIPFAFLAGLALGYFCVATGSIWTSITIHFLNNLSSVIITIYYERNPDGNAYVYIIVSAALLIIGAAALVLFLINNDAKLVKKSSELSPSMKRGLYLCTPTLTASVIYFTYTTILLQTTSGVLGMLVLIVLNSAVCAYFVKNIIVIRRDRRLAKTNAYVFSMVFTLVWAFFGTLLIVSSTLIGLSGAVVTP